VAKAVGCRGVGCGVREGVDGERDDRGEHGGFGCGGDIAGGGDVGRHESVAVVMASVAAVMASVAASASAVHCSAY